MMKKLLALLAVGAVLIAACKKKKDEPTSESSNTATAPKPQFSATVNGQTLSCNSCFSSYYSGGLRGVSFYVGNSGDRVLFNFSAKPTSGNYSLVKFGDPSFTYQKDNVYYRGRGSLEITAVDTSASGTIKSIAATFSCKTDTSNNLSFEFKEGSINVSN